MTGNGGLRRLHEMIGGLKHLKEKAKAGKRDPGKVLQRFIVVSNRVIDLFRAGGEGAPDV